MVILYSISMKFWVNLLWWYTLIQTEKFRMVLHDTVEKKSKKLSGPGGKKNSSLIVSWTIHFILNYCRLSAKEVRASDPDRRIQVAAEFHNPYTVYRPTDVCDAVWFLGPSLLATSELHAAGRSLRGLTWSTTPRSQIPKRRC